MAMKEKGEHEELVRENIGTSDVPKPPTQIIRPIAMLCQVSVGTPTISLRSFLSHYHIQAAALFARLSGEREQNWVREARICPEHRAFVIGAVLTAVAFLEATINEIFADAHDAWDRNRIGSPDHSLHPLGREVITRMAWMWENKVPGTASFKIPQKYQIALALAGKDPFDTGCLPFQDIPRLIALRNALVHFEPEWSSPDPNTESERLRRKLEGRFKLNRRMMDTGNPFFPDKCLGHGCARWAVQSSPAFTDDFFQRMGISSPIGPDIRARLMTE